MEGFLAHYADFHFLRPLWLSLIIPALVLTGLLRHRRTRFSQWHQAIDGSLLPHLLDTGLQSREKRPLTFLLLAWIAASVGAAGPVWQKMPQPVQKSEDALVIIQDLSLSLYAEDLNPNRLTRAQHKIIDILKSRKEGTTALVVYSGDAHVVCPLTDDTNTISTMIPALTPEIMPSYGSNVGEAVALALDLFREASSGRGKILLLTDEITENDIEEISSLLNGKNVSLSVIGVGTEEGGPIPVNDGGFLKDARGAIVIPRMNRSLLRQTAAENLGRYSDIQLTDSDIDYLLAPETHLSQGKDFRRIEREFDQWDEQGFWLVLLVMPVALSVFRRGWLLSFVLLVFMGGQDVHAFAWEELWQGKDQRAARAFAANDFENAAALFQTPGWKGAAAYRAGRYEEARLAFSADATADGHYNRGNSLAGMGKYAEARDAYAQALQLDPHHEDARFNRDLVRNLLQQQEQQRQRDNGRREKEQQAERDRRQGDSASRGQGDEQQHTQPARDQSKSSHESRSAGRKEKASDGKENTAGDREKSEAAREDEATMSTGNKNPEQQEAKQGSLSATESSRQIANEQQQDLEQWLRLVPENSGGLLQRKFEFESRKRQNRRESVLEGKIW
ncbi:MAG: hypothetical protein BM485_04180 [Desulfobulbaceae bacterium DB1]|nr:MAG: hypothetical protein BM485_04180 [Desulfobulbaceae bacterium DB1]